MDHLFVVKHEKYGYGSRLSENGVKQIGIIGNDINQIIKGGSIYIFSSNAPQSLDTSKVLAVQLSLGDEFEKTPYLWSGKDSPREEGYNYNPEDLMKKVNERRDRADGLILVTHCEVLDEFSTYFFREEFGKTGDIRKVNKERAVHFNLMQQTYQFLPRL